MRYLLFLVVAVLLYGACAQEIDLVGTPDEDLGEQLALNVYIADNGQARQV